MTFIVVDIKNLSLGPGPVIGFPVHHLHQLRHQLLYSTTLHLAIPVKVHIITKFITRLLIHVTTIASGNEGDGSKFTGKLSILTFRLKKNFLGSFRHLIRLDQI